MSVYVTFETPPRNEAAAAGTEGASTTANGVNFFADLNLRVFKCEDDNENHTTDIWQGFLTEDEDPRNIYFDHPIDESDMCIFPVVDFVLMDVAMTGDTRNCPAGVSSTDDGDDETEDIYGDESVSSSSTDEEHEGDADKSHRDEAASDESGVSSSFYLSFATTSLATVATTFVVSLFH